jgi:hypothetical protein
MPRLRSFRWLALPFVALFLAAAGIAVYAVATAPGDTAPMRDIDPGARDATPALAAFLTPDGPDRSRIDAAFARIADRLRETRIVIVPSWLADGLQITNRLGVTDYFDSQIAGLRQQGLAVELAPVDTEASVADNAAVLARLVAADDRPVCFISHSKGGLDVLAFLLEADAKTRARIACWVALQAPFHGSPIADLAAGSKPLRALADPLAEWLGGSRRALDDLTIATRRSYMADNAAAIRTIVAAVPTLAVATRIDTPNLGLPALYMRPSYDWMAARGEPNDGLVPVAAAVLPGARYVVIPNLDHTDTVADNPQLPEPADRLALLKALLMLALGNKASAS